jgi:cellulose synthase/poly-beta-1,6-N-acetylglucosamine synthase-like glycosyltransferase
MAEICFWGSLFLLLYTYVGYPLVLILLAACKRASPPPDTPEYWPTVSIVLAAYNEELVIRGRIKNLLNLDYPQDRLEIFIVSDASTDQTDAIVGEYRDRGVTLMVRPKRAGKTEALNAACPRARGDILLFTDANGALDASAVKRLVRHLSSARVGCVSGAVRYFDPKNGAAHQGEGLYMRYDSWLKRLESMLGSVVGAYGGNFAFRKEFFKPMDPMVPVDLEIPLQVLRNGYQVVYEPSAISLEPASPRVGIEFSRHARISARTFYCMTRWVGYLLNPFCPFVLFQFASKKLLRWVSPFLVFNLMAIPFIVDGGFFTFLRLAVGLFLLGAGMGAAFQLVGRPRPLFSFALHFLVGNAAVAWGLVTLLSGRQGATWSVARES